MSTLDAPETREGLLAHARAVVTAVAAGRAAPSPHPALAASVPEHSGCFVTLHAAGRLRGCIGTFGGSGDLASCVGEMAVRSSTRDPRFPPVRPEEVAGLDIEISALSPLAPCPAAGAIRLGVDGVELECGGRRAVFLPQVATEQGWDREALLDALAQKAGLAADAWRRPDARLWTFEATVFGEAEEGLA
jgi:AmmeMemoRadiSam system protein A